MRQVPQPLAISKVSLAGRKPECRDSCAGHAALVGATDISEWGGWRAPGANERAGSRAQPRA
ncbi:MAG: hypothetical protein IPK07_34120 [Deltaproteobacteria bacterium]|nr:hypothetical protein [Deltaproteobacteria bacterium]